MPALSASALHGWLSIAPSTIQTGVTSVISRTPIVTTAGDTLAVSYRSYGIVIKTLYRGITLVSNGSLEVAIRPHASTHCIKMGRNYRVVHGLEKVIDTYKNAIELLMQNGRPKETRMCGKR